MPKKIIVIDFQNIESTYSTLLVVVCYPGHKKVEIQLGLAS